MEDQVSEEEENNAQIMNINLHSSVNNLIRKDNLSFSDEKELLQRNRSCSVTMNFPKNFVPKLKPIKTGLCPSPISLCLNCEIQNSSTSTINESQNDLNSMQAKYLNSKKKSFKIINIEEETIEFEAMSDNEDKCKKRDNLYSDLDSSENNDSVEDNKNEKGGGESGVVHNIKIIRQKMMKIRKSSKYNDSLNDDSNIDNSYRLNKYKNICAQKFIDKIKGNKNMNLLPLESNKCRTKSFNPKQRYIPTILGFLEKSKSSLSLNSNGK